MGHSPNNRPIIELPPLPEADHYLLAFSGGSDSTALLHCLVQQTNIKKKLSAIHINHQIHQNADQWARHCQNICQNYGIPSTVTVISSEKSDENSLRTARYKAFSQHVDKLTGSVVLLTAHHLNDDVETMVFRLLRGTGLNGLTGMNDTGYFHGLNIYRPFINTSKSYINQYLTEQDLTWVEDSSNLDTDYDRNYIRQQIMPLFAHFRPDALHRIKDSRDNLTASLALLEHFIGNDNPIPINDTLSHENLATYLYHWLANKRLNPASRNQMLSFSKACLQADRDKMPSLKTEAYTLISWQHAIYALRPHLLTINTNQHHSLHISNTPFNWQHEFGNMSIYAKQAIDINVNIFFNQQGEKIQLPGRDHHSRVKEVLREANIPPWQRSRLPFVYSHNKLMAVGPIISTHWQDWLMSYDAEYDWHSTNFLL